MQQLHYAYKSIVLTLRIRKTCGLNSSLQNIYYVSTFVFVRLARCMPNSDIRIPIGAHITLKTSLRIVIKR